MRNKNDFLLDLQNSLGDKLADLSLKKGLSESDYDGVKTIIMMTADYAFDEGFEFARMSYAISFVNGVAEIFKK